MDIVTLAMAKPKIIDLTKFTTTDGHTFNDLLFSMMAASLESDGALQTMTVNDTNQALKNAMSTDRQIVLSVFDGTNTIKNAAAIVTAEGTAMQCTVTNFIYMTGIVFVMQAAIVFSANPNSNVVDLLVKATPVTA